MGVPVSAKIMHANGRISVQKSARRPHFAELLWRASEGTAYLKPTYEHPRSVLKRRLIDWNATWTREIRVKYISATIPFSLMRSMVNRGMRRVIGSNLAVQSKIEVVNLRLLA